MTNFSSRRLIALLACLLLTGCAQADPPAVVPVPPVSAAPPVPAWTDQASGAWSSANLPPVGGVYSVVADLLTPGRFYVCEIGNDTQPANTEGGVFRTDDAGASWTEIFSGSVHAITADQGVKNRVAVSEPNGISVSTDSGSTWTTLQPLPNRWVYDTIAFSGNHVLVGTGGNGAFWAAVPGVKLTQAK